MSAVPQSMTTAALDRRIQMLRRRGPLIAAALEDRTWWKSCSTGSHPLGGSPVLRARRWAWRCPRQMASESSAWSRPTSVQKSIAASRCYRPSCPKPANASRASCRRAGAGFALRKRAIGVIPLERYVVDGMMTTAQAGFLARAVRERQNVLIAGATSSGKTTLANALLAEIAATGDRVLVLEDTVELQCAARDHVPLRTRAGVVSMTELVRSSMRLRPDRVVVGEVRGAEALDLIKVHRPPRRHRHDPRRLRARCTAAPGATDSRSGGEPAACADRRGGQRGDPHRRTRTQAPHREHRPRRRL